MDVKTWFSVLHLECKSNQVSLYVCSMSLTNVFSPYLSMFSSLVQEGLSDFYLAKLLLFKPKGMIITVELQLQFLFTQTVCLIQFQSEVDCTIFFSTKSTLPDYFVSKVFINTPQTWWS